MPNLCQNTACRKALHFDRVCIGSFYCNEVCRKREKSRRHTKRMRERKRLPNRCAATTATGSRCTKRTAATVCYLHEKEVA